MVFADIQSEKILTDRQDDSLREVKRDSSLVGIDIPYRFPPGTNVPGHRFSGCKLMANDQKFTQSRSDAKKTGKFLRFVCGFARIYCLQEGQLSSAGFKVQSCILVISTRLLISRSGRCTGQVLQARTSAMIASAFSFG